MSTRRIPSGKTAYRDLETDLAREFFDFFEAELDRGVVRGIVLPVPQQRAQVDPDTARGELPVDDSQVVDDVLRLLRHRVSEYVRAEFMTLTVSMKKQVRMASHRPACGSPSSYSSGP